MNQSLLALCRQKLEEVAKAGRTISYGELAAHMKVANQSLGPYLMEIFRENKSADLTLVVVYKGTDYGRFRGEECKRPETALEMREYDEERMRLYQKWAKCS